MLTLNLRALYALTVSKDEDVSRDEVVEAAAMMEDVYRKALQVFGAAHPKVDLFRRLLGGRKNELVRRDNGESSPGPAS